ncbi:MAG: T9SS type A sorting domain-containing protein [Bacteroidota bacterium]
MKKLLLICGISLILSFSAKAGCSRFIGVDNITPLYPGDSITLTLISDPFCYTFTGNESFLWYRNDTLIEGATQLSYVAKKSGVYKINAGSSSTLASRTVIYNSTTTTSIIDLNKSLITLYPNPNNGIFKLSIDNVNLDRYNSVLIYDMSGKFIQQEELTNETSIIDISTKPRGIYFIKVMDEDREIKIDKIVYQ